MLILPDPYRPRQIANSDRSPHDRDRPVNYPVLEERSHLLASVRGFDTGGFEMTVRTVDLQALIDAKARPRGHRKPVDERSMADVIRSVQRAKRQVRHAVKQIGADHLLTLSTRELVNTPESLAAKWKAWVRRYRFFANEPFPYVAIPELHPKAKAEGRLHWHLHVAIRGRLKLKLARHLWWHVCGGRGQGNVDVQYIRVGCDPHSGRPQGPLVRAEKIARYISKYITKDLLVTHRPDKKRYWRSEFDLPEARHYWLRTRPEAGGTAVFQELQERFGHFAWSCCSMFMFPDGSGFWFSYNPDRDPDAHEQARPPPF